MGHAIAYLQFNIDGDMTTPVMRKIEAECLEWARNNADLRENPNPHLEPLRVIPSTFKNRTEAERYLGNRPDYSHVAVRYAVHKATADVPALNEKLMELKKKAAEYVEANQVWTRTSEFIGCSGCGSRLSRVQLEKLHTSSCPLCRASLLSPTVQGRIEGYLRRQRELVDKINAAHEGVPTGKTAWLVRCEVHC